jgi:hypothetical protein
VTTRLIETEHLIEACGDDIEKLTALSVLIGFAAVTLSDLKLKDPTAGKQLEHWQRAVDDIYVLICQSGLQRMERERGERAH